jgi:Spy/CpxP family protein refolding chaperone
MKRKTIIGIGIGVAAVILSMVGCGHKAFWSHGDSPEARAEWVVGKIADRLDLNPQQQEELDGISKAVLARHDDLRASHDRSRQQMLAMVRSDTIDRAELDRLVAERKSDVEALVPFFLDKAVALHALLTPEQREKLAVEIENHHSRRHGCWQRWSASK